MNTLALVATTITLTLLYPTSVFISACVSLQLGPSTSSAVMKLFRQKGDPRSLRRLRLSLLSSALSPALSPPLRSTVSPAGLTTAPPPSSADALRADPTTHADIRTGGGGGRGVMRLTMSTWEINETIALCLRRGATDEAMGWYLTTMADAPLPLPHSLPLSAHSTHPAHPTQSTHPTHLTLPQPSELTFSMLLAGAAGDRRGWEGLFYLLGEMKIRGVTPSKRR